MGLHEKHFSSIWHFKTLQPLIVGNLVKNMLCGHVCVLNYDWLPTYQSINDPFFTFPYLQVGFPHSWLHTTPFPWKPRNPLLVFLLNRTIY